MIVNTNESTPISSIQFQINSDRRDMQMFNALLECNIIEAYDKNGIITLTEDVKESKFSVKIKAIKEFIFKKIGDFIEFLVTLAKNVKKFITTEYNKLIQSTIVHLGIDKITAESIKDMNGKINIPNLDIIAKVEDLQKAMPYVSIIDNRENLKAYKNPAIYNAKDTEFERSLDELSKDIFITKKFSNISNTDIAFIKKSLMFNPDTEITFSTCKYSINQLKKIKENAEKIISQKEKTSSTQDINDMKISVLVSDIVSREIKMLNNVAKFSKSTTKQWEASSRSAIVNMIKYIDKKEKEKNTNESTEFTGYMITEASTDYIEKRFEKIVG